MLAFFNSLKGEYIQNPIKKCEYLMIQHTLWYSLKKKTYFMVCSFHQQQ